MNGFRGCVERGWKVGWDLVELDGRIVCVFFYSGLVGLVYGPFSLGGHEWRYGVVIPHTRWISDEDSHCM